MAKEETAVTLTTKALQDIISETVKSVIQSLQSPPKTPDDRMVETLAAARPEAKPVDVIRCQSPGTQATFDAHVCNGRVVRLDNYAHPAGVENECPPGLAKQFKDKTGMLMDNPLYKQWKYETYWKADLMAYVGKPLPRGVSVADRALFAGT